MEAQQGPGTSPNSDDEFFRVRTLGLRDPEAQQSDVAKALAAAFKIPEDQALQVIRGSAVVAKRAPHDKALRLKKTLLKLGVHARVEKLTATTEQARDRKAETGLKNFIATVNRSSNQVQRSSTYRYWALAAASAAVVAPLLYLSMIIGVILGLFGYVSWVPGPRNFITLIAYVTPIVIALVVFVFLVRPFFTRYTDPPRIEVSRQNAPGLFALARQVSICVGTPEPQAIYIDNQVNASVSPTGGLGSLAQQKLELTVGMPLVYGMNARELASVIAHEFGHFSQPVEMFSGAAVNTVNGWMARCAWYEDPWETRLARWRELDWSVALVAQCALWSISGVRYLMRGLLALNTRITRRLSQEMEFNADDHAVHVIGSQAFVDSSNSIRELLAAQ
ncbi:MAG: M48 family metallopeptidase, partial [Pseudomonadota bacterium]